MAEPFARVVVAALIVVTGAAIGSRLPAQTCTYTVTSLPSGAGSTPSAVVNDGSDDSPAVDWSIAQAGSGDIICFPAGTYDFYPTTFPSTCEGSSPPSTCCGPVSGTPAHVLIANKNNITLRGSVDSAGLPTTIFVCHDRRIRGILINQGSNHITVENIIVHYKDPPFTEGLLHSYASDGSWIKVQIDSNYPNPLDDCFFTNRIHSLALFYESSHPDHGRMLAGTDLFYLDCVADHDSVDAHDVVKFNRLGSTQGPPPSFAQALTTWAVVKAAYRDTPTTGPCGWTDPPPAVQCIADSTMGTTTYVDTYCTFTNVTVNHSSGSAFSDVGGSHNTYSHCKVLPRPDTVSPTGGEALLSSSVDGFSVRDSRTGLSISYCETHRTGDDGIILAGKWGFVWTTTTISGYFVVVLGTLNQSIRSGDTLQFYSPTTNAPLGQAQVVATAPVGMSYPDFYYVALDTTLSLSMGDKASCYQTLGNGFGVTNNIIHENRSTGITCLYHTGGITGNVIDHVVHTGIFAGALNGYFDEAGFVHDLSISNNTITDMALFAPAAIVSAAIAVTVAPPFGYIDVTALYPNNSTIAIENNTVINSSVHGLLIAAADRITVSGNIFVNCQRLPDTNLASAINLNAYFPYSGSPVWPVIRLENATNVTCTSNYIEELHPPSGRQVPGFGGSSASNTSNTTTGNYLVHYNGWEPDESAGQSSSSSTLPDASPYDSSVSSFGLNGFSYALTSCEFVGDDTNSSGVPYYVRRQSIRATANGGSVVLSLLDLAPQILVFSLGAGSLSSSSQNLWACGVLARETNTTGSWSVLAAFYNTSSDLNSPGGAPYWAVKTVDLSALSTTLHYDIMILRYDLATGCPEMYLDDLAVVFPGPW